MRIRFTQSVIVWAVGVVWLSGVHLVARVERQVVGQVVSSSGAFLEGVPIPNQGTILDGDLLTTGRGGSALVKFSVTAQANISEEASIRIRIISGRTVIQLTSGLVSLEGATEDALVVQTPKYEIGPATPGKSVFVVAVLADQRAFVSSRKGSVSVAEIKTGKSFVLPEGEERAISEALMAGPSQEKEGPRQAPSIPSGPAAGGQPAQPASPGTAPGRKQAEKRMKPATLGLILGAGAAAGIGAAIAASSGGGPPVSPSRP